MARGSMKRRWMIVGIGAVALALGVAFFTRGMGFTARATPWPLEERLALAARRWATPAAARGQANPVALSKESLASGMAHWADHCATCHANDGGGSALGRSFYPPAPDMRLPRTQALTDGELFYVIERGIPFTGMPAWGNGTAAGERDSWELVHFIRRLPGLTAGEIREMEKLNPKSAAELEQERHIQEFLKGGK